jgi:hypothetical protein
MAEAQDQNSFLSQIEMQAFFIFLPAPFFRGPDILAFMIRPLRNCPVRTQGCCIQKICNFAAKKIRQCQSQRALLNSLAKYPIPVGEQVSVMNRHLFY